MIERFVHRFWKDAACLSGIAILIVIVFWPALFEGRLIIPTDQFDTMTLPFSAQYGHPQAFNHNLTDAVMQSYPWKVEAQRAFRKGEFFFWNPLIFNGYPQSAASRHTYDVFNLLLLPLDLPFAFTLILVLELFTAGVGMFFLLRTHGRGHWISLMFALAWTFNGMFLTDMYILWPLATFCWVPFALATSLRYQQKNELLYLFLSGSFLGLALLGATLQSAVFALFILALTNTLWSWPKERRMLQISKCVFIPCMIALGLSAVMWVPSIQLFLQVLRHGSLLSPAHAHPYTIADRLFSFLLLGTFFVPELMGLVRSASITTLAGIYPMDFSGYLGFSELLLGSWALFTLRLSEKIVRPYGWLVVIAFLVPIFTPLYSWLYHRFFLVGTLGLAVIGAERLEQFSRNGNLRNRGQRLARWALPIIASVFVILAIVNIIWTFPSVHNRIAAFLWQHSIGAPFADGNAEWVRSRIAGTFAHYSVLSPMMFVPFGLAIIACITLMRWDKISKVSPVLGIVILIGCSSLHTVFWWGNYIPMLDPKEFPVLPTVPSITFLQHHADEGRIYIHRRGYPGKQYLFLDNEPLLYGLSTVTGYESEVPRSFYPELLRISDTFPHPKALGFLGVSYLVFYPGLIPSGTLPMADSSSMAIYANPFARPRAALYYRKSILANDSVILDRIFDENDPHDCVWFTTTEDAPSLDSTPAPEWEPAAIVRSSENEVDLKTNASRSAYLVLTDSYYPGWNCFVDGKPQKIYRCNFNMRAVLLSAGAHHVAFIFWPYTAVIGGWCSFCTVLFLVLGSLGVYWRRKSFFGHE